MSGSGRHKARNKERRDGRCSSVIDVDYSLITVIFYVVLWPTYSSLYLVKH